MQCLRRMKIWAKKKAHRIDHKPMRLLCWLIVGIVLVFGLVVALTKKCDWGETGYAAFGSLFSALAFAGMIVTVLLQRSELQEQRKELRAQRHELEGQKKELEVQNRTAQLQRFENSFFHLLEGFKKTVEGLEGKKFSAFNSFGLQSISDIFEEYYTEFYGRQRKHNETIICIINKILTEMPSITKKLFLEYFLIIDFIITHDAFLNNLSKISKYITILNTTLKNREYQILFYAAIANNKIDIVNKYKLFSMYSLKNDSHLPFDYRHILFFSSSAFGSDYDEYIKKYHLEGKTLADYFPEASSPSKT